MPDKAPGTVVPIKITDPRRAWFAWRSKATFKDDPLANFEFGLKLGQRIAIERTASWAGLVPLLQDVLDYLIETAIERAADMGVGDLTGVNDSATGEHVVPGVQAVTSPAPQPVNEPDLTVEADTQVAS